MSGWFDSHCHVQEEYLGGGDKGNGDRDLTLVLERARAAGVDAVIHTKSGRSVLTVPTSAILRNDENLPFVYVEVSTGKFAQRLINIGAEQGDETEIVTGLKEGEKVVAQGSVFLQFANSNQ